MGDVVRSEETGPGEGDPATRHALPPRAHARRASRSSLAQGSATAEPAPQVSQAIATATLREEDGRLDGALRTRTLLDAYPWGAVRAQPHPERTLALG